MIRKQIYMTKKEVDAIRILSKKLNVSESEYIRRILDAQLTPHYFVVYVYRDFGKPGGAWLIDEVTIEEYPLQWLLQKREEDRGTEYHLIFWSSSSKINK